MTDAILQRFFLDHGAAVVVIKSLGNEQVSAGTVSPESVAHIPTSLPPKKVSIIVHLKTFRDHATRCRGTILQGNYSLAFQEEKKITTF